jgi:hypothetical protein
LTNVPVTKLYIYDPGRMPHWRLFDPAVYVVWSEELPILLRAERLGDAQCIGIEHFVRSLHTMWTEALEVPEIYREDKTSDSISNGSDE